MTSAVLPSLRIVLRKLKAYQASVLKGHSHIFYSLPVRRPGMEWRVLAVLMVEDGCGASFSVSSGQKTPWLAFFVPLLLPLIFEAFFSLLFSA